MKNEENSRIYENLVKKTYNSSRAEPLVDITKENETIFVQITQLQKFQSQKRNIMKITDILFSSVKDLDKQIQIIHNVVNISTTDIYFIVKKLYAILDCLYAFRRQNSRMSWSPAEKILLEKGETSSINDIISIANQERNTIFEDAIINKKDWLSPYTTPGQKTIINRHLHSIKTTNDNIIHNTFIIMGWAMTPGATSPSSSIRSTCGMETFITDMIVFVCRDYHNKNAVSFITFDIANFTSKKTINNPKDTISNLLLESAAMTLDISCLEKWFSSIQSLDVKFDAMQSITLRDHFMMLSFRRVNTENCPVFKPAHDRKSFLSLLKYVKCAWYGRFFITPGGKKYTMDLWGVDTPIFSNTTLTINSNSTMNIEIPHRLIPVKMHIVPHTTKSYTIYNMINAAFIHIYKPIFHVPTDNIPIWFTLMIELIQSLRDEYYIEYFNEIYRYFHTTVSLNAFIINILNIYIEKEYSCRYADIQTSLNRNGDIKHIQDNPNIWLNTAYKLLSAGQMTPDSPTIGVFIRSYTTQSSTDLPYICSRFFE